MPAIYPGIPEPAATVASHQDVLSAIKELIEILTRQRGDVRHSTVTWDDLLELELVTSDQLPQQPTRR